MSVLNTNLNLRAALAGLFLALTGFVCLALILLAGHDSADLIAHNRAEKEAQIISTLLPAKDFGADLTLQCKLVSDRRIGNNMKLYLAYDKEKALRGYIMQFSTSRGYASPMILVASFDANKNIYRSEIQLSRETPGLGDKVDRKHSDFLDQFHGQNLTSVRWDVKKFGGDLDYFTGATVTSRAVVLANHDALQVLSEINPQTLPDCKDKE